MADGSRIEWTDATWNVVTGCSVISAGCRNCYAMKLAGTRLRGHPSREGLTQASKTGPVWTGEVRFNDGWLDQPLRWRRPRRIFVAAHGDLFHEKVKRAWLDRIFDVMERAPHHVFQVLTKRSGRMSAYVLDRYAERTPPAHIWFGVSVEDPSVLWRLDDLMDMPAAIRWVSLEPLLDFVDLSPWVREIVVTSCGTQGDSAMMRSLLYGAARGSRHERAQRGELDMPGLDWIVLGGESGGRAAPMHPDWARHARDVALRGMVPFHFKQWGEWLPSDTEIPGAADAFFWAEGDTVSYRVGKKAAGAVLDGREHRAFPA